MKKDIRKFIDPKTGEVEEIDMNSPFVGILTAEEARKSGLTKQRPHVPKERLYSEDDREMTAEEC